MDGWMNKRVRGQHLDAQTSRSITETGKKTDILFYSSICVSIVCVCTYACVCCAVVPAGVLHIIPYRLSFSQSAHLSILASLSDSFVSCFVVSLCRCVFPLFHSHYSPLHRTQPNENQLPPLPLLPVSPLLLLLPPSVEKVVPLFISVKSSLDDGGGGAELLGGGGAPIPANGLEACTGGAVVSRCAARS